MSQVKVVAYKGNVVNPTKNPDVAWVRVEQEVESIVNGWLQSSTRGALIMGKPEQLESKFRENQVLTGKIVVRETLTPRYDGQSPKINPATGEILTKDGEPIYRNTMFTPSMNDQDELIEHDREEVAVSSAQQNVSMAIA